RPPADGPEGDGIPGRRRRTPGMAARLSLRAGPGAQASASPLPPQQRPQHDGTEGCGADAAERELAELERVVAGAQDQGDGGHQDRKSTRLNSSHVKISYAV